MKGKPVEALGEVAEDLKSAAEHYQSWREDGREHILQKYDETVSQIARNPESFPRKFGFVQRAILKQSYYLVYFMQEAERCLVLAVLDGRRNPYELVRIVNFRRNRKSKS